MSITIRPDDTRATIDVTTAEEAAAVVAALPSSTVAVDGVTTIPVEPWRWDGPTGEDPCKILPAADTGVVEGGPVEEPKRECRTWTPLEEEHLQVWYRDGCSVRQIADRLGRSWSSVNNKRLHLARGRDRLNLDPMREDEK